MDINAPKYSEVSKADAFRLMDHLRDRIVLPDEAIRRERFNSNSHTLWVLESQATEKQFIEDPVFHVSQALVESAKSDWWYAYEKDYGTDDYDYSDDEDYEVEE